jgi:plasmid stabilization system protein ParE
MNTLDALLQKLEDQFGKPKTEKDYFERQRQAQAAIDSMSTKAGATLAEPNIKQSRDLQDLNIEGLEQVTGIFTDAQKAQLPVIADYTGELTGQRTKAFGERQSAASKAAVETIAPSLEELKRGSMMDDATANRLIDKSFEDRAAVRDIQRQALDQRKGDRIFDMIRTLGIGGALLLS